MIESSLVVAGVVLGACAFAFGAAGQIKVRPFELGDVKLLDGEFRDAQERNRKYLHDLDADRLLHMFRVTAGLPLTAQPLGGWEAPGCELRGHFLGHYLSACALMYRSTGDEELKAKVDKMVAALAECQAAMPKQGYHRGFLSAYPETFFDRVDRRERVWAPYYTLHKLMAGLLDAHLYCGNAQALTVLEGMADWLKFRVDRLSHEQMQASLGTEHGGMNEVLANLYAVTKNPDHLRLAIAFNHEFVFEPLAQGEDKLNGLHANTQIPKIIGAAREYELNGDEAMKKVATFFWERVALHRSYCIGGHSDSEHFFPIEDFGRHLSPATAETCNTYNMLKLTRHVFSWEPTGTAMDFYERALFNQILASQDPKTGMMGYFIPLKPGHFLVYNTPNDSFWCCTGTGVENHAKYSDTIYFHDEDSLWVNLMIPSQLTWKEKGLTVRQETRFPEEPVSRLTIRCEKPVKLNLHVRYPAWTKGMTVSVNGKAKTIYIQPGSYETFDRIWQNGDVIEIRWPMDLRVEYLPETTNRVAVLYGPIVLAGELGTEGMPENLYLHKQLDLSHVPSPTTPVLLCAASDLINKVERVAGTALTFRTKGIGRPGDVTLSPLYRLHFQRYNVYWELMSEADWAKRQDELAAREAARKALEGRLVDDVHPGQPQSETDHLLKGQSMANGMHMNRAWRHANHGGWFSYEMRVDGERPMTLRCTYWGGDTKRMFEIQIEGKKIATQTIDHNKPGAFFDVIYAIPAELTMGKAKVSVKFVPAPGSTAGGVFGVVMLKSDK